jgi:hypothetical protein
MVRAYRTYEAGEKWPQNIGRKLGMKRILRKARYTWERNVKFKIEREVVNWINFVLNRDKWRDILNMVIHLRVS